MNSTANRQKIRFTILPGKITKMSKAKKVPSRYLLKERGVNRVASANNSQ